MEEKTERYDAKHTMTFAKDEDLKVISIQDNAED